MVERQYAVQPSGERIRMHRVAPLLALDAALYLSDGTYAQVEIRAPLLLHLVRDLGVTLSFPQCRQNVSVDQEHQ